jgi:hypothetical protein
VTFSPDGLLLASASHDTTVKLWDAKSGQEVRTLRGHTGGVTSVTFSPDGLAVVGRDRQGKVPAWEVNTGKHLLEIPERINWNATRALSPDGKLLALPYPQSAVLLVELRPSEKERRLRQLVSAPDPAWHKVQGQIQGELGNAFAAGFHLDRLTEKERAKVHSRRALAHCRFAQWDKAAVEFGKSRLLQPGVLSAWTNQLLALAGAGDVKEHRKVCEELLKTFGATADAATANEVAW